MNPVAIDSHFQQSEQTLVDIDANFLHLIKLFVIEIIHFFFTFL